MKKIRFAPNWCSAEQGTQRLMDQFYIGQDFKDIKFVFDDEECDIVFYCGYENGSALLAPNVKKYIFNMEPRWSGNVQRSNSGIDATIYAQDKDIYSDPSKVVEVPTYMFYGAGGEGWTYADTQIEYEKTKNISCVISTLATDIGDEACLYKKRLAVVDTILNSNVRVDVFGRGGDLPNCAGGLPRKIEALKSYKFSIGIENSREQNYISEKFYDCILTNVIPIYYGAKNIKEVFPENGYFIIEDIENTEQVLELLQYINANADALYEQMLPELKKIKNRFFTEFNLLTKILELADGK